VIDWLLLATALSPGERSNAKMIRIAKLTVVMFLLVTASLAGPPKVGEPAPAFTLSSSSGSTASLKDYAGRSNVVLVFYRGYW
jgi:hypothetical protein